jgi:acetylornithine/N-succinyldiaminopimelate aminotransferase
VLDVLLEPGFLERVKLLGLSMRQRLAALQDAHPDLISEVRGEGLMLGLKLTQPNTEFVAAARRHHLLVIAAGDNVVRLLPPLVISEAEIAEGCKRLEAACADLRPAGLRAGAPTERGAA